jgi:hypothetical protein
MLTTEQRQLLATRCTHPVVVCCAAYRFDDLALELLGGGTVRCPVCALDLTPLVLEHVAACRSFGGDGDAPATWEARY